MRMMGRIAVAAAVLGSMTAAPAAAQNYRWDVGLNGGYSWYSSLIDGGDATDANLPTTGDFEFKPGLLLGAQIGYWFSPRVGLRANATYADRPLVDDDGSEVVSHVNLWSGSGDLMLRLRQPNSDWMGTEVLPYVALGLGGKWHNPSGDEFTCVDSEEDKSWACAPFGASGTTGFALGEQKVIMGLVGLGTDVRLSPGFALRLELNDRIYKPQAYLASAPPVGGNVNLPNGDALVSDIVHEVGLQVGLHMLMGLERAQVVTVAPAPAPTPAPRPTPAPAPAPREDAVSVCVIDPTVPSGIRMQNAIYRYEQRDTVVMVNGQRVPLRQAVGNVMVARNADWYVRGEPLTLRMGNESVEYLTYQGARQIEANRLAYLGTVNGFPVYADRDEVADVIDALNTVRQAEASRDLGEILAERRDLRDELADIQFLYVPLESTGCVFQTVQVMEQVRKGK